MTLDDRARRAAEAMKASLLDVTPPPLESLVSDARPGPIRRLAWAAPVLALLLAAVIVVPRLLDGGEEIIADPGTSTTVVTTSTTLPTDVVTVGPVVQVGTTGSTDDSVTVFSGSAEPDTVIVASSEFGSATTVVDDSGQWTLSVPFADAPTGVEFPVVVSVGDDEYRFSFTSGEPEKVTPTADQRFGLSADEDPFEIFSGTAEPGTLVTAVSPFGSGEAVTAEDGSWRLRIDFGDVPFDEPFVIDVTVGDTSFAFPFVWRHEPRIVVTAEQVNESSANRSPVAAFTGSAPVGSVITASSDFGSAEVVVDDSQAWSLDLGLGGLPLRVEVPITLAVDGEVFGVYGFTWLFEFSTSAAQGNTASDALEPKAGFSGTAPPGTVVTVTSAFGSGETTADSTGAWSLMVEITDAPAGEAFPITVTVGDTVFDEFSFVWTYQPPPPVVTVVQTIESSDSAKPVVGFAGTAVPGTTVVATSEFGSAEVVVDDTGSWLLSVLLVDAPTGEAIPLTVTVGDDVFDGFSFTWSFEPSADGSGSVSDDA